jgi:hypothetical protein
MITKRWLNRLGILIVLGLPFVAGGQDGDQVDIPRRRESLVAILARPDDFDGREIRFVAYVSIGFEHDAIWLGPSDHENGVFANAIGFEGDKITSLKSDGYAEVKGVFHKADPRDYYSGTITPTYVRPWELAKAAQPAPEPPRRGCAWFL